MVATACLGLESLDTSANGRKKGLEEALEATRYSHASQRVAFVSVLFAASTSQLQSSAICDLVGRKPAPRARNRYRWRQRCSCAGRVRGSEWAGGSLTDGRAFLGLNVLNRRTQAFICLLLSASLESRNDEEPELPLEPSECSSRQPSNPSATWAQLLPLPPTMLATFAGSAFESYMMLLDRVISLRFRRNRDRINGASELDQTYNTEGTAWDRATRASMLHQQRVRGRCQADAVTEASVPPLSSFRPRPPILKGLVFSGREFEREFIEYLERRGHEVVRCQTLAETLRAMERGAAIIAQAPLSFEILHGRADLLIRERVESAGDGTVPLDPPWDPFLEPRPPSSALPPGSRWIATVPQAQWSSHHLYRYTVCECKLAQQVQVEFPIQAMAYLWMLRAFERRQYSDLGYWPRFYLCLDIDADAHVGQVLCRRTAEFSLYFEAKLEEMMALVRREGTRLLDAKLVELPKRIIEALSSLDMLVSMRESRRKLARYAYAAAVIERYHQSLLLVAEMRPADARLLYGCGIRTLPGLATLTVGERRLCDGIPNWRLAEYVHQARLLARKLGSNDDDGGAGPLYERRANAAKDVMRLLPASSPMDMYLVYMSSYDRFYFLLGTWCPGQEPAPRYLWASTPEDAAMLLQRFLKKVQASLRKDPNLHVYHFGALDRHALMEVSMAAHDADVQAAVDSLPLVDLRHILRACLHIGHEDPYTLWSLERIIRPAARSADDIPVSPQLQAAELYERYRIAQRYRKTASARILRYRILSLNIWACQLLEETAAWLRKHLGGPTADVTTNGSASPACATAATMSAAAQRRHSATTHDGNENGVSLRQTEPRRWVPKADDAHVRESPGDADAAYSFRRNGELGRAPSPSTPFVAMMQMLESERANDIPEKDAMMLSLHVRKELPADDPMRDLVDYIRCESKIEWQYLRWRQRPEIALDIDFYDDPDVIVDAVVVACQEAASTSPPEESQLAPGPKETSASTSLPDDARATTPPTAQRNDRAKPLTSRRRSTSTTLVKEVGACSDEMIPDRLQTSDASRPLRDASSAGDDPHDPVESLAHHVLGLNHGSDAVPDASRIPETQRPTNLEISKTGQCPTPMPNVVVSAEWIASSDSAERQPDQRLGSRVERTTIFVHFPCEQRIYPENGEWQVSILAGDAYVLIPSARLRFVGSDRCTIEVDRATAALYLTTGTRLPRIVRRPAFFRRLSSILGLCVAATRPEQAVLAARYLRRERPFPELARVKEPYRSAEDITQVVDALYRITDGRVVLIQGPPGSGKTHTIAECVGDLLCRAPQDGRRLRIGICANAHTAIDQVLHALLRCLHRQGIMDTAQYIWRIGQRKQCSLPSGAVHLTSRCPTLTELSDERRPFSVIAGTAFALSHIYLRGQLDYLFVDEAGQLPRAYFVAMLPNVRRAAILVGDQMQLSAVSANGSLLPSRRPLTGGESSLTYLLGPETSVIGPEWGWFLPTSRRMSPSLCRFISTTFYEGRLQWHPSVEGRCVWDLHQGKARTGLGFLAVDSSWSLDFAGSEVLLSRWKREVGTILRLVWRLVDGSRYQLCLSSETNLDSAARRPITADDILIVAPYNEQVTALRAAFSHWAAAGASSSTVRTNATAGESTGDDSLEQTTRRRACSVPLIGTVDKFQGQERPIAIMSLCAPEWEGDTEADVAGASRASTIHESIAFVLDSRRLNVALSRAQCLAIVVGEGRLGVGTARHIESVAAMNLFLRLRAHATPWTGADLVDDNGHVSVPEPAQSP
ncbi:NFX1-type zinc finger-containing protein 1 [Cyanidiococcus yangmingshanensis]|uniref:NFX1-type zinc finger-containing protein 1 n=1 Tax=Cyanidiococcus yangmingshanensis TaxID=2690220 RepID=A0A7J7IJD0_9RHOD|nr:NFX1-type zinc finger-containing protein 1 [Cyanidiococcus yangmingshanensis]